MICFIFENDQKYLRIESLFWLFHVCIGYLIHTFMKRPKSTFQFL